MRRPSCIFKGQLPTLIMIFRGSHAKQLAPAGIVFDVLIPIMRSLQGKMQLKHVHNTLIISVVCVVFCIFRYEKRTNY